MGDRLVGNGRVTSEGHPYFSATNQGSQWRSGGVPIHKISATEQMSLVEPPLSLAPDKLHVVGGSRPRHMPRYDWATLLSDAALDLILAVCSLTFLGFAVLAHHYDQAPVDGHQALTAGLQRATTYGPTVFPILFAAVMGRATKHCMLWRLERGERLGLLDTLASSTTVVNALLSQVSLRRFSLVGCAIAVIWAWSPVGGQAALRIMTIGATEVVTPVIIHYLPMNSLMGNWFVGNPGPQTNAARAMYSSAILSPIHIKSSPVDTWSNVKVPMIEALNGTAGSDDPDGWHDVPPVGATYSALIGLPVLGVDQDVATFSYVLPTSYWTLDCPALQGWAGRFTAGLFGNKSHANNTTDPDTRWEFTNNEAFAFLMYHPSESWGCNRTVDTPGLRPRAIGYASPPQTFSVYRGSLQALCYITTSYVDVKVVCATGSCRVEKIRKSPEPHPSSAWTTLDTVSCQAWYFYSSQFVNAVPHGDSDQGTIVEGYLSDPLSPMRTDQNVPLPWEVGNEAFAIRFAQLLNTFWLAMIGWDVVPGGPSGSTVTADSPPNSTLSTADGANFSTVTGESTRRPAVIECHHEWFAILLMVSLLLVFASLMPAVIRTWTRAPVLLLNVSDMLKDSPYVSRPTTSSTLNSSDRARVLKDLKVQYGDVAPEDEIGHIAIGSVQDGRSIERVRKKRLYD